MGLDDLIGKAEELAKEKVSGHDDQIDNAVNADNWSDNDRDDHDCDDTGADNDNRRHAIDCHRSGTDDRHCVDDHHSSGADIDGRRGWNPGAYCRLPA